MRYDSSNNLIQLWFADQTSFFLFLSLKNNSCLIHFLYANFRLGLSGSSKVVVNWLTNHRKSSHRKTRNGVKNFSNSHSSRKMRRIGDRETGAALCEVVNMLYLA